MPPAPSPSPPANATTSLPGLMSAADKTKLNGVAAGATNTALSNANPADITDATDAPGTAGAAARIDHTHAHGARGGGTLHANVVTGGASGFMTGAQATKLAGLPTSVVAGAGLTSAGDLTLNVVANADGSIVANADDVQVGVLATDAQHGLRGGGTQHAVATQTVAGFESAADKTKLDNLTAEAWAVGARRFFALDYDGGNDANVGFSDVSMAAAGAVAKKTWSGTNGLLSIIPLLGKSRLMTIAIKSRAAGATYLKQDNVTVEDFVFRGAVGYATPLRVLATLDFSDDATDRIKGGGVTAITGPGGSGEWTADGTGATTGTFSVTSGSLPAENGQLGFRLRFTGNVTASLANVTRMIWSSGAGLGPITVGRFLPVAPATGDTFFIERPGVVFNTVAVQGFTLVQLLGLASASNTAGAFEVQGPGDANVYFCEARGASSAPLFKSLVNTGGSDNFLGFLGACFRTDGMLTYQDCQSLAARSLAAVGGLTIANVRNTIFQFGDGSVFKGQILIENSGVHSWGPSTDPNAQQELILGRLISSATVKDMRFDTGSTAGGGISIVQSSVNLRNIQITNCSVPAVGVAGLGCRVKLNNVTGSTGNTSVGLDLTSADHCVVSIDASAPPTVTGTVGDIKLGDGVAIAAWADLSKTNVIDSKANDIQGSVARVVAVCRKITNKAGLALAVGEAVRGNGTTGQVTGTSGNDATTANSHLLGVMVTAPANNADGYMTPLSGFAYCVFDGTPTQDALVYLSPGTVRAFTTTVVAQATNNNRLRCGRVVSLSGSTGIVSLNPENLPSVADGSA